VLRDDGSNDDDGDFQVIGTDGSKKPGTATGQPPHTAWAIDIQQRDNPIQPHT
jgi:hypothetical protein